METIYKVNQFESSSLTDELALICTLSNGAEPPQKIFLDDLLSYVRCKQVRYPSLYGKIKISILTGSHIIIEDDKTALIEIMEANIFDCPTLDHNNTPSAN
jgi:hypothetical protein